MAAPRCAEHVGLSHVAASLCVPLAAPSCLASAPRGWVSPELAGVKQVLISWTMLLPGCSGVGLTTLGLRGCRPGCQ